MIGEITLRKASAVEINQWYDDQLTGKSRGKLNNFLARSDSASNYFTVETYGDYDIVTHEPTQATVKVDYEMEGEDIEGELSAICVENLPQHKVLRYFQETSISLEQYRTLLKFLSRLSAGFDFTITCNTGTDIVKHVPTGSTVEINYTEPVAKISKLIAKSATGAKLMAIYEGRITSKSMANLRGFTSGLAANDTEFCALGYDGYDLIIHTPTGGRIRVLHSVDREPIETYAVTVVRGDNPDIVQYVDTSSMSDSWMLVYALEFDSERSLTIHNPDLISGILYTLRARYDKLDVAFASVKLPTV